MAKKPPAREVKAATPDALGPGALGAGRASRLRPAQHPLHLRHRHRRVGPRQADSLLSAHRPRRAVGLGLRLGRPAPSSLGAVPPTAGLFEQAAREIKGLLTREGVADMPVGIDVVEPPFLFALQKEGIVVRDGQQVMLEARVIKNTDELSLLNMAAAMGDGVYQDIFEELKPGIRENEIVALANKRLYEMGSDCVEAINAISGERCSPHPHNFTDRMLRPGDQAYFDIIQSFVGYRTCYYRTFSVGRATAAQHSAYKKAREWMDSAIELIKPGVSTERIAKCFPKAQEIGFESEMAAFGLNFCHGLGLGLHERPIISRLNSLDDPMELKEGMVFAVETYCPATDGISAARIEEEVIVTPKGAQIITLFPAEELPIANRY